MVTLFIEGGRFSLEKIYHNFLSIAGNFLDPYDIPSVPK